jgi:hypothetical protein
MTTDKTSLKAAREETHSAVQLMAMVPRHLLSLDPTDSSASLIWDDASGMLTTQVVADYKVAYAFATQEMLLFRGTGQVSTLKTIGHTFDQVFDNLKTLLNSQGLEGDKLKKELPYELPASVVQKGHPFEKQNGEALSSLQEFYAMTSKTLQSVFGKIATASEIRCWPHHYDLATLVTIVAHEDPEEAKTIGFGFSPGDGGYDEPYFYLTPWPYPATEQLYKLTPPAFWNTEGWTGGVLKASDLNNANAESTILAFFENGYHKLKEIL